ncbi:hypothetical protein JCM11251_006743 [Rhodosporidiobolus azoricus]
MRSSLALLAAFATFTAAAPRFERDNGLSSCLRSKGLQPITQGVSSYEEKSAAYNQRLQPLPSVIIYPSNPSEISAALSCASSSSTRVSARGGGHSYASYGLGGDDGALVIDLGEFRNVTVDGQGRAMVGAGNRLGDIYLQLNEQGGWAVAAGTCPGVGIGGHAGFGGFGLPSRMWGLLSDQVIGYDLVLANGTILTNLTRTSNPDLFWGLNGAAPNFGIVTTYHLQAHHAPATAVVFSYDYYNSPRTVDAATAFSSLSQFANLSAPANLGIGATIGKDSLSINGVWYGPKAEFLQVIQPLKAELPGGFETKEDEMSWIESAAELAGNQALDTKGEMLLSRDSFYAKSLMTPSTIPIDVAVVEKFLDYLWTSNTSTNWFVEYHLYGGQYSEITNSSLLNESSFGFRDKFFTFQLYASSQTYGNPYPDSGVSFVQGMYDTIVDGMTSADPAWSNDSSSPDGYAGYVNYVDPELSFDDVKRLYWGQQYDRLSQLKAEYDPQELLHNSQGIRPANSTA